MRPAGRRRFLFALGATLGFSPIRSARPQQPVAYRIGVMASAQAGSPALEALPEWKAFAAALAEQGYLQGRNTGIQWYLTAPRRKEIGETAARLVGTAPDVIVVSGTTATLALKRATRTIPVVALNIGDPVGAGIVSSLRRPGGNITGIANLSTEINAKRLELLTTALPGILRIGALLNPENRNHAAHVRSLEESVATLGLELSIRDARNAEELRSAFVHFAAAACQAVYVQHDTVFFVQRRQLAEHALRRKLPTICGTSEFADAGALMSYGANRLAIFRSAARLVDKILKGADVGGIPFERVSTLEFVINRRTEQALGLRIPQSLLLRADRVIE